MEFLSTVDKYDDEEEMYSKKEIIEKKENKKNEENKEEIKQNTKEDILKYTDLTPIKLIECIEHKYNLFLPSSINEDKINQLLKNKISSNTKFKVLEFKKVEKISEKFFNQKVNSLTIQTNNYLFIGENDGTTRMISIEKEEEIKSFVTNELKGKNISVSAIDVVIQITYIVIGYENGNISIFDIELNKLIICINNIHKSKILALQFLFIDPKKQYEIISTDLEGNVYKIDITIGFFKNSVEKELIYKDNSPTYGIDFFKPFSNKNILLGSFANCDSVRVFVIKPSINELYIEEKNKDNNIIENNDFLPDISIGWGCEPIIGKDNIILTGNSTEDNLKKNVILISIAWDKVIKFFTIDVLPGEQGDISITLHSKKSVGYLINNSGIIRIGFISPSIIYIFDKNFNVKIINTAYCIYGNFDNKNININNNNINNNFINDKAFLEKGFVVDPNIKKINLSNDNSGLKKKNCYRQFIRIKKKTIYLGCETCFYIGKLLDYEDCSNELEKEKKWFDTLSLGIDIIQGSITSFPDVPINEKERRKTVIPFLKKLILRYIDFSFKQINNNIKDNIEYIINLIYISIEFCVEIRTISFLFNDVLKIFDSKGLNDEFYQCIEPFIFYDKVKSDDISNSIPLIYGTYKLKKELNIFSHLIIHLNYKSINNEFIKRCSVGDKLFSSIIYLFSNGKDSKDYFLPIVKMFNEFVDKNLLNNRPYQSYVEAFKKFSLNDIESEKEFIGHKLLWYIDLCLNGKKFFLFGFEDESFFKFDENSEEYKYLICLIYIFLLRKNVIEYLLPFDSYNYLNILSRFFIEKNINDIIKSQNINEIESKFDELYKEISLLLENNRPKTEKESQLKDLNNSQLSNIELAKINYDNVKSILQYVIAIGNNFQSFYLKHDINCFIIKLVTKFGNGTIENKIVIETLSNILQYYDKINNSNIINEDIFKTHLDREIDTSEKISYKKELSQITEKFVYSGYRFLSDDISKLIILSSNHIFVETKIKLLELKKDYNECLNLLLENKKEIDHQKIFDWINSIFLKFSDRKDKSLKQQDLYNLQESVLSKITQLMELNVNLTLKVIDSWYDNSQKILVLNKLESLPELQFKYLEKILSLAFGGSIGKNTKVENDDFQNDLDKLLLMQINLFIKLDKKDEILPNIKKRQSYYPIDDVLKICLDNKLTDICVYLYQIKGDNKSAFEIIKKDLINNFNLILEKKDNEEEREKYLNEYFKILSTCTQICENNSDSINRTRKVSDEKINETSSLWYNLLDVIYDLYNKSKEDKKLESIIHSSIENILKKMCLFVSIKHIIETVSEKNQNAEFKEFKDLLSKMLRSYGNFSKLLGHTKLILKKHIEDNFENLYFESNKGNVFPLQKCDLCDKNFELSSIETVFTFHCGHKFHKKCTDKDENNNPTCTICERNELESLLLSHENNYRKMSDSDYSSQIDYVKEQKNKQNQKNILKLKIFEKTFNEKYNAVSFIFF